MSATADNPAAAPTSRRFAPRPQPPVCPTRRGFEDRPRADSRRRSSLRVYEWPHSYSGGRDGPALTAASTRGGAIGDANVRRCQGARRQARYAILAMRSRGRPKTGDPSCEIAAVCGHASAPPTADAALGFPVRLHGVRGRVGRSNEGSRPTSIAWGTLSPVQQRNQPATLTILFWRTTTEGMAQLDRARPVPCRCPSA